MHFLIIYKGLNYTYDEKAEIKAYAFPVDSDQLWIIDEYERSPVMFERKKVKLLDKEGNYFDGYVYKIAHYAEFEFPSDEYLDNWALSKMAYYYLSPKISPEEFDYKSTSIEIWKAGTNQKLGYYYLNNIKYDDEISEYINSY